MVKPYSTDLRERALERVASGQSARTVASILKVSVSSVIKWSQRHRQTQSVAPSKMGGHRPHLISGEHRVWLLERVRNDMHVTLHGLAEELGQRGLDVDHVTVWRFLRREKQSYKKNHTSHRTKSTNRCTISSPLESLSREG